MDFVRVFFMVVLTCFTTKGLGPKQGEYYLEHCEVNQVAEGETGILIFSLLPEVNASTDSFYVNLAKEGNSQDILRCHKKERASPVKYEIKDAKFQFDGIAHNNLAVSIPNITMNFSGTYVLNVYANENHGDSKFCSLTVMEGHEDYTLTIAVSVVAAILVVVAVVVILLIWRRKKKRKNQPHENNADCTELACLRETNSWYHGDIAESRAEKLLSPSFYRSGAFLVMRRVRNGSEEYLLKAKFSKQVRTYIIKHGSKGYWLEKDVFRTTLPELIKYYKHNKGCLPKPLSVSPRKQQQQQRGPDDP